LQEKAEPERFTNRPRAQCARGLAVRVEAVVAERLLLVALALEKFALLVLAHLLPALLDHASHECHLGREISACMTRLIPESAKG
jgi:hypothetical protein